MLHTHIVLQKRIHVSAFVASSFLLVLFGLAFFPVASSSSDTLAAPAPSETTLSMTAENINLDLSVDNPNGTFNASDPASLTVATNNYTGYTLSILASTSGSDASKLVNGAHEFSSISTTSSANDFNNGNWGLLPSKVNSAVNSSYIPAPTTEGTTLDATNSANADANSYTLALGAKADYTLPAGRYSNTFVVVAVANPVGYSITYDDNTTDEVGNMPATQTGDLEDTDITISSNVPTRTGYTFNNWCDDTVTATNGIDSCAGNIYEPGDTFATSMQTTNNLTLTAMWNRTYTIVFEANDGTGTMPDQSIIGSTATLDANLFARAEYDFDGWDTEPDGTGTSYIDEDTFTVPASGTSTTLYAQWKEITFDEAYDRANKTKDTTSDKYLLSDMSTSICSTVTTGQTGKLVDIRDGVVYSVGKLADGRCWLLDNLKLDLTATGASTRITSANTNADTTSLNALFGTAVRNAATDQDGNLATAGVAIWPSSTSSYSEPLINTSKRDIIIMDPIVTADGYMAGIYYNYCAASAGSYCYGDGASAGSSAVDKPNTAIDAEYDICPAGWRMPTGYNYDATDRPDGAEYQKLLNKYPDITGGDNQYTRVRKALLLPLAGNVTNGTVFNSEYTAVVWSSTFSFTNSVYYLGAADSAVGGQSSTTRDHGSSVRCIAK